MTEHGACFDVMGTLFDLGTVRERLEAAGAPPAALETWFSRTLHAVVSITAAGEFHPFPDVAEPTLRSVLAQLDLDPGQAPVIVAGLAELDPFDDVPAALERLAGAGVPALALTNGTEANTRKLLQRAGIEQHFAGVVSVEAVGAYKPVPAVYQRGAAELGLAPEQVTLVAAHAWDCFGARRAGMRDIWVQRLEREWPLPVQPSDDVVPDVAGAVEVLLQR
jgi:2-haloacid dehalogenase